jgi:Uma2 family endonuclease
MVPPEHVPCLDDLVTEDHKPVERIFTEKLYRLLTHSLYASWPGPVSGRTFLVLANVGWFYQYKKSPVVPDCLLALDVPLPENLHTKEGHSYYQWEMGKSPKVIIEIVSDRMGGEDVYKKNLYADLGVAYYAIFDPDHYLSEDTLQLWELRASHFERVEAGYWPDVGLGLTLWRGTFEGYTDTWLRWCDETGKVIPTGEEAAAQARDELAQARERIRELEEALRHAQDKPPAS